MIKKTLIFVLLFSYILCGSALANDAGDVYIADDLFIKASPITKNLTIGEEFKFEVEFTNTTPYNIRIGYCTKVFGGEYDVFYNDLGQLHTEIQDDDIYIEIEPYETLEVEFSYIISDSLDWYYKQGEFYSNLDCRFRYWFDVPNEDIEQLYADGYQDYDFITFLKNPIPVKIDNLLDGKDVFDLAVSYPEKCVSFVPIGSDMQVHYEANTYTAEYETIAYLSSNAGAISHVNKGGAIIEACENCTEIEFSYWNVYYIVLDDIEETLEVPVKIVIQCDDGKYYALEYSEERETYFPEPVSFYIEYTIPTDTDGANVTVTNKYDWPIENIVISFPDEILEYEPGSEDILISCLAPGESITFYTEMKSQYKRSFMYGYIGDSGDMYMFYYSGSYDGKVSHFTDYPIRFDRAYQPSPLMHAPYPPATPAPDVAIEATPDVLPTPKPSPSASPSPQYTDAPQAAHISIVSIRSKNDFPAWVWMLFALASIGTVILTLYLLIKSRDSQ